MRGYPPSAKRSLYAGLSVLFLSSLTLVAGYPTSAGGKNAHEVQILNTLGGNRSAAFGLNDQRQVCGEARNADGQTHAALWSDGNPDPIDLGVLEGTFSRARRINAFGQIIGEQTDGNFLWQPDQANSVEGTLHALPLVQGADPVARDINDAGVICGHAGVSGISRAIVLVPTAPNQPSFQIHDLGLENSYAADIDNDGNVYGIRRPAQGPERVVVWTLPNTPSRRRTAGNPAPEEFEIPIANGQIVVGSVFTDGLGNLYVGIIKPDTNLTEFKVLNLNTGVWRTMPALFSHDLWTNANRLAVVGHTTPDPDSLFQGMILEQGQTRPRLLDPSEEASIHQLSGINGGGDLSGTAILASGERRGCLLRAKSGDVELSKRSVKNFKNFGVGVRKEVFRFDVRIRNHGTETLRNCTVLDTMAPAHFKVLTAEMEPRPDSIGILRGNKAGVIAKLKEVLPGATYDLTYTCTILPRAQLRTKNKVVFSSEDPELLREKSVEFQIADVRMIDMLGDDFRVTPIPAPDGFVVEVVNENERQRANSISARSGKSEADYSGPFYLILEDLQNATVRRATGSTKTLAPLGRPYIKLKAKTLPAGKRIRIKVGLIPTGKGKISFTPRLAMGPSRP